MAKKATKAEGDTPEPAAAPANVTVRVVEPAGISEAQVFYKRGETLEVTEERAAALGDVVEVVK